MSLQSQTTSSSNEMNVECMVKCDICFGACIAQSAHFEPLRLPVKQFLNYSADGRLILSHYEENKCLSDQKVHELAELLIKRETLIILITKSITRTNPLTTYS